MWKRSALPCGPPVQSAHSRAAPASSSRVADSGAIQLRRPDRAIQLDLCDQRPRSDPPPRSDVARLFTSTRAARQQQPRARRRHCPMDSESAPVGLTGDGSAWSRRRCSDGLAARCSSLWSSEKAEMRPHRRRSPRAVCRSRATTRRRGEQARARMRARRGEGGG